MPIYEYECPECRHKFEKKQSFHDEPRADCPECRTPARRVFHPAPIIFKGSGFYVTDHRDGSSSASSGSGSSPKPSDAGASKSSDSGSSSSGPSEASKSAA